jgi:hypothetical protein
MSARARLRRVGMTTCIAERVRKNSLMRLGNANHPRDPSTAPVACAPGYAQDDRGKKDLLVAGLIRGRLSVAGLVRGRSL